MRGVTKSRGEGKSSVVKHGYSRNNEGYQRPDGEKFKLIKEAWSMRYQGLSLEATSKYLNNSGYFRAIKVSGLKVKMDIKILIRMFKDPFYFGLLIEGSDTIDLRFEFEFKFTESHYIPLFSKSNIYNKLVYSLMYTKK